MSVFQRARVPIVLGLALVGLISCSGSQTQSNQPGSTGLGSNVGTPIGRTGAAGEPGSAPLANGASASPVATGVGGNGGNSSIASGRSAATTPTIGLGSSTAVATPEVAGAMAQQVTVELASQNNSNITGTATLSENNGVTHVQLLLTGSTSTHPAHIHDGACPNVDPNPKWPLNDVQSGSSVTDLNVSLAEIMGSQTAINVHTSPQDETPVACGNIMR